MTQTLAALTIVASLTAGGASAFEANLSSTEASRIAGKPIVGDLSVGVKALIESWDTCLKDKAVYLPSTVKLEISPNDWGRYYEIRKQADGEFTLEYQLNEKGDKRLPAIAILHCSEITENFPEAEFYPVKSINGFTDMRSFWVDLINQGYE